MDQNILDNIEAIQKIDTSDMLSRLVGFGEQCREAIEIGRTVPLVFGSTEISNIVVAGLGGSAIGGDLLRAYLSDTVSVPILVNRNYTLPRYVSTRSLIFVVSYSGNTEETLSVYDLALEWKVPMVCITSGGKLGERAAAVGKTVVPVPSGYPPRTALGYLFFPMLMVLARMGLGNGREAKLEEAVATIVQKAGTYHPAVPVDQNRAKQLALRLHERIPLLYASEMLYPVARRWSTQIAENAESLAHANVFPELNHNEIMSWAWLHQHRQCVSTLLFRDQDDHPLVQQRMDISAELLESDGLDPLQIWGDGEWRLARLFSLICLGDFVSFYLALLRGVDPTPVERIESLKAKLKRSKV